MGKYKLDDVIANKKPGEEWYSLEAPEEAYFWTITKKWPTDFFSSRGISPVCVSVAAVEKGASNRQKFTQKSPMVLDCGVEITSGYYEIKQDKVLRANRMRVDSCVEFNQAMVELCKKTKMVEWWVSRIHICQTKEGVETEFIRHKPDGRVGLYLHRVVGPTFERLYPDVMLTDQHLYVGKFYNRVAHCTAVATTGIGHGCAIEQGIKKKQIKTRKNA